MHSQRNESALDEYWRLTKDLETPGRTSFRHYGLVYMALFLQLLDKDD